MNYITRERVQVDRIATAWAIRNFIDPAATFDIAAKAGAVLALRRNPQIYNRALHDQRAYHRMPSGRSATSSNVVALFMLQQHRPGRVPLEQRHVRLEP